MKYQLKLENKESTILFGKTFAKVIVPNLVIVLLGDLGSGKTTFTQGVALGLNIKEEVKSPTFAIINIYEGTLPLFHFDVYRLQDNLQDLGFNEYFYAGGVSIIEWGNIIKQYLPEEYLIITFAYKEHYRTALIETNKYEKELKDFIRLWEQL
ncbi:MAG: tRNA (adenosine(37)-N6)-threonylcarbamoyltransferase complex ATPase subunit type 1 TsaE [Bacillales bacterium]|nr:tRNA (adenosine(37)-N6)-threonylcarbamoyltransferase complex ATPase subunit type 1 TsaE [Bacillales bacterium]